MQRKTKYILGLMQKLDDELKKREELFFKEKPFLRDTSLDREIINFSKEREENEKIIETLIEKIQPLINN